MSFKQFLTETSGLTFSDESRGYHHGQSDMTLTAFRDSKYVGSIDYSIYHGEISIQMIHTNPEMTRQGIATQMLHHLQSLNPDTELDFGMLTDSGSKLYHTLNFKTIPNPDTQEIFAKVKSLESQKESLEHDQSALSKDSNDYWDVESKIDHIDWELDNLRFEIQRDKLKPVKKILTKG